MDHRYLARPSDIEVNGDRKTGYLTIVEEDEVGELETQLLVNIEWEVCESCGGRGVYVNPNIDAHGLSREDFDEDPDFADDYRSGVYDVRCGECRGERVVPIARARSVEDHLRLERWERRQAAIAQANHDDAYAMRMESGGW